MDKPQTQRLPWRGEARCTKAVGSGCGGKESRGLGPRRCNSLLGLQTAEIFYQESTDKRKDTHNITLRIHYKVLAPYKL